ncbi:uncharacterized protein ATC70_000239 [Mucor velutinosus]|uniref:Uncharacterized protein n=1 Tax=Mucor velutinosus TaxID=708070 RepID=A0AAN7DH45_9FUNG|nr:hypothetical protein ATC70_000239 [Mucor velutinosus]
MKPISIISLLFCLYYVVGCYARCDCDATDNACISECVVEANSCVTSCEGDVECYEGCIDDKWPDAGLAGEQPAFNDVLEQASNSGVVATSVVSTVTSVNTASASASISASISVNQAQTSHISAAPTLTSTGPLSLLFVCLMGLVYSHF